MQERIIPSYTIYGTKEEFINVNKDVFKAYVTELDFSDENATTQINQWVADSTNNKIKQIIQPPIAPNTAMYLINAIYFKGEWTDKFDKRDTFAAKFYSGNGETREVMMMSKKDEIEYGEGDDFKVVRLPYGEEKVSMYCILPAENIPINDFIKDLDSNKWEEIKNSVYARKDLYLNIPRFKIEYGIKNLNNCLIAMGMEEAFLQDKADFSGIADGTLFINQVLHKAIIEVDEKGSEAAAATSISIAGSAPLEPPSFIADRPFIFIITEDTSGTILFIGKLYDCEKY